MANYATVKGIKTRGNGRYNPLPWQENGFTPVDWNKWAYTWPGNFPVFTIKPGLVPHELGAQSGLVAECGDIKRYFRYGTGPADIRAELDDAILEIMRQQADDAEAIDWEADGLAIDFDSWIGGANDRE